MPWAADVPFPAEDLGVCRGCGAKIGWVRSVDPVTDQEKPHPVEAKGWAGVPCGESAPGARKGRTLDGDRACVVEPPPSLFPQKLDVVFESHFVHCPKADRFRGGRRA